MEINRIDLKSAALRPVERPERAPAKTKAPESRVEFSQAAALEKALANTPEVRPERVDQARRLVGDPEYPPRETLQRIATLLAIKLSAEKPELDV
jgi:hypothetical protein